MLTVICVCKSGEFRNRSYDEQWVLRLRNAVKKHLTIDYRFVCLTDLDMQIEGVLTIPLRHNWKAWWSKIELFRADIPGDRFLYLDLDTLIIDNLDELVQMKGSFIGINPNIANKKQRQKKGRKWGIASGIMVWDRDYRKIYEMFEEFNMDKYAGDQDYISAVLKAFEIEYKTFPRQWIKLLREFNINDKQECKIICCSPNGWRQDLVVDYKGKNYKWVDKVWKGKMEV